MDPHGKKEDPLETGTRETINGHYRPRNTPHDQGHHDRHYIASPSRSLEQSDEDDPRGPLSQAIMEAPIPPGMEKPPT